MLSHPLGGTTAPQLSSFPTAETETTSPFLPHCEEDCGRISLTSSSLFLFLTGTGEVYGPQSRESQCWLSSACGPHFYWLQEFQHLMLNLEGQRNVPVGDQRGISCCTIWTFINDEVTFFETHIKGILLLFNSFCYCVLGALLHRHYSLVFATTNTKDSFRTQRIAFLIYAIFDTDLQLTQKHVSYCQNIL